MCKVLALIPSVPRPVRPEEDYVEVLKKILLTKSTNFNATTFYKKADFPYSLKKQAEEALFNALRSIESENGQGAIIAQRLLAHFNDIVNSPIVLRFWDSVRVREEKNSTQTAQVILQEKEEQNACQIRTNLLDERIQVLARKRDNSNLNDFEEGSSTPPNKIRATDITEVGKNNDSSSSFGVLSSDKENFSVPPTNVFSDQELHENENTYIKDIQSSHENTTDKLYEIIEKINKSDYRLFQYRIINLSDQNASSPVQKILTKADKQLLKTTWDSLEPSKKNHKTIRQEKWNAVIKPLVKKYQKNLVPKSVFDDFPLDLAIEEITKRPYTGKFNYREHHDSLWVQDIYKRFLFIFKAPVNVLLDPNQVELSYRENFINPIVAKLFDDIMDIIRVKTGEIENMLNKTQRNETRQYVQRVSIGCHQDGIFEVNVNAMTFEIGFLEVVGNALIVDITKLNGDLDKVLKAMQISLFYQRRHHTQRGATGDQLVCLESYGIIVYQRTFTIYVMHNTRGGLYIVDKLTEFSIPNSKDQLYVLEEVIEKIYMLKSRIMDYYLKIQKITPNCVKTHVNTTESPVEASPSKNSKVTDR
ncbi:13162_t:CDS:10 [Entrophospora sp. SA101]|nr:13162_t:CDS:10 [Entrophospora sp. SA101]CAJ0847542.1 49_t:CDS:10 [Entrophospora sp. SA101]